MDLAVLLRKGPHDNTATNNTNRIRYALKCDSFSVQITKTPIQIPIPQQSPEIVDLGIFRPSISIGGLVDTLGQSGEAAYGEGTVGQTGNTVQSYNADDPFTEDMVGSTISIVGNPLSGGIIEAVDTSTDQLTVSSNVNTSSADAAYTITKTGFENMESIGFSRPYWSNASTQTYVEQTYYIPYKNALEETVYKWISTADTELELEIGDATYPRFNTAAVQNSNNSSALVGGVSETGGGVYSVALQQSRFQVDPATEDRWTFQMQFVCTSRADVTFS